MPTPTRSRTRTRKRIRTMPDLIDKEDLVSITRLNNLVEVRKCASGIEDAHIEVEKVLGRTGYALIYENAPDFAAQGTDAPKYVKLLEKYIKPFMAWRARERGIVDQYAEPDKAGVYVKDGNDHRSVSRSELSMVQAGYAARADMYSERLRDHIKENESTFTWFGVNVNNEDRIDDRNAGNVAGISFRKSRSQSTYRG